MKLRSENSKKIKVGTCAKAREWNLTGDEIDKTQLNQNKIHTILRQFKSELLT
jgi:hypothetical protein